MSSFSFPIHLVLNREQLRKSHVHAHTLIHTYTYKDDGKYHTCFLESEFHLPGTSYIQFSQNH